MDILLSNFSNIANAIGWTLIHFLWQGLVLFIGYWAITRLFLKDKINIQYWVGIIFMLLCLILPIRELFTQLAISSNNSNIIHQIGISITEFSSNGILNPTDILISLIQKFIPYLVIVWLLSVLLISSHLVRSWLSLVKLSKDPSLQLPENLSIKLKLMTEKLKLKFRPIISINSKIDIPATFGYFKPVILLPASLIARLPQNQMEAILLHELCHIKRADFLHNILQLLVETLFFYHPLTRWISKDIRTIREQCCDELVLKHETNPLIYAKALTNIAEIYNDTSNINAKLHIQIAATDGELFNRIKFLMIDKRSKSPLTNLFLGLMFSITALLVINNIFNTIETETSYTSSQEQINLDPEPENNINRPRFVVPNIYSYLSSNKATKKESTLPKANTDPVITTNIKKKNTIQANTIEKTAVEIADFSDTTDQLNILNNSILNRESNDELFEDLESTDNSFVSQMDQSSGLTVASTDNAARAPKIFKRVKPKIRSSYPIVIKRINPSYEKVTRIIGAEGTVILSFNIDAKGRVKKIKVDKNSPLKILDSISRQALRRWRFDPNSINEVNINHRYQQIFRFSLNDEMPQCIETVTGSRIRKQICRGS
jgi:TonB family protein